MRKNRQTGTMIRVEPSDNGAGWMCICEDHDRCCDFDSKAQARSFAASPIDWCEDCGAEYRAGYPDSVGC